MALSANRNIDTRRGRSFAYPVKAGVHFFRDAVVGVTATGLLAPAGTAGVVALVGLAPTEIDNTAGPDGVVKLEPRRGIFALTVPAATHANLNAAVYAVDDGTLSLSAASGANLPFGTLVGIEAGQTYVEF